MKNKLKKYKIIYADPPYKYTNTVYQDKGRKSRDLKEQYPTMSISEIKSLPIENISDSDCALFMWITDFHLPYAFELFEKWGFKYRTIAFVWKKITKNGKTCANLGAWTMKNTEICLLATKGNMFDKRIAKNIFQIVEAVRTKHSKKPIEVIERIEKLFGDLPRIELFCRYKRKGWDAWGNEVKNSIDINNYK
jgi:site-specific DNA-methyltransferase (adenine-specific)